MVSVDAIPLVNTSFILARCRVGRQTSKGEATPRLSNAKPVNDKASPAPTATQPHINHLTKQKRASRSNDLPPAYHPNAATLFSFPPSVGAVSSS